MRLKENFRIGETVTRPPMSGPVAQEFSGKIGKNRGKDETTQYNPGKVLSSIK